MEIEKPRWAGFNCKSSWDEWKRLDGLSKNGEAQMSWLHIWKRLDGPGAYGKYELSGNGKAKMGRVEMENLRWAEWKRR